MAEGQGPRLPGRATRGQRMSKILDDEVEADEQFWNQEAFQEAENDAEYEDEGEVEDVFDSDFDEEEPESEEEGQEEEERRVRKKLKGPPGGRGPAKRPKRGAPPRAARQVSALEEAADAAAEGRSPSPAKRAPSGGRSQEEAEQLGRAPEGEAGAERRKSSRTAVVVKAIEREAIRAAQQPKAAVKRKRGPEEERRWTQEEMLLEAAQTEILNRQSLEVMLAREEEVKRRAVIQKESYEGPKIRLHDKDGRTTLEFTRVTSVPPVVNSKAPRYPKKQVCVVTGRPAKYRDPLTGLPYATREAFKLIRERVRQEEAGRPFEAALGGQPKKRVKFGRDKKGPEAGLGSKGRAGRPVAEASYISASRTVHEARLIGPMLGDTSTGHLQSDNKDGFVSSAMDGSQLLKSNAARNQHLERDLMDAANER